MCFVHSAGYGRRDFCFKWCDSRKSLKGEIIMIIISLKEVSAEGATSTYLDAGLDAMGDGLAAGLAETADLAAAAGLGSGSTLDYIKTNDVIYN